MGGSDWDQPWSDAEVVDGFTCPTDPAEREMCDGCQ